MNSGTGQFVAPGKTDENQDHPLFARRYLWPFILVTSLFFLWGIPNNLNDVLIRQFMKSFAISRFQAGLVQSAFYMGYFLLSMPAALMMRRVGYKAGLCHGLAPLCIGHIPLLARCADRALLVFPLALFVIAADFRFWKRLRIRS